MNARAIKRIADDGTVTVYPSIAEAARQNFVGYKDIMYAARGDTDTCIGFRWEYADGVVRSFDVLLTTPDGKTHYYPSIAAAAMAHGLNSNTLRVAMCYGRNRLNYHGYIIERMDERMEEES